MIIRAILLFMHRFTPRLLNKIMSIGNKPLKPPEVGTWGSPDLVYKANEYWWYDLSETFARHQSQLQRIAKILDEIRADNAENKNEHYAIWQERYLALVNHQKNELVKIGERYFDWEGHHEKDDELAQAWLRDFIERHK